MEGEEQEQPAPLVGFLFGNVDENQRVEADYLDEVIQGRCRAAGGGPDTPPPAAASIEPGAHPLAAHRLQDAKEHLGGLARVQGGGLDLQASAGVRCSTGAPLPRPEFGPLVIRPPCCGPWCSALQSGGGRQRRRRHPRPTPPPLPCRRSSAATRGRPTAAPQTPAPRCSLLPMPGTLLMKRS